MPEMQFPSLGWEDPLEEEMATHSNILAWEIPWTEEPGGLQSVGSQRVDMTQRVNNSNECHRVSFVAERILSCSEHTHSMLLLIQQ